MMKKILPYILIFVIFANFLAPFTLELNSKNKIVSSSLIVEAADRATAKDLATKAGQEAYDKIINAKGTVADAEAARKKEYDATFIQNYNAVDDNQKLKELEGAVAAANKALETATVSGDGTKIKDAKEKAQAAVAALNNFKATGQTTGAGGQDSPEKKDTDRLPDCSIWSPSTYFTGCLAQALYYILFIPTSYLFALAGVFFDNTLAYSVQDESYRSVFVVEGWAVVRDICNMFFIFILLYIAIRTILNLHDAKTKEMIINVVVIGLFLNFSLFATQVIIDASNVLARVFYNADIIKISEKVDANGVTNATPGLEVGPDGVIPISAAIVNKVNPQKLIINSEQVGPIEDRAGKADSDADTISAGTFVLVTILTVAINIFGIITFLSVGLIFVSRVIGLWLAMVIAPLAFLTYAIPSLKDTKMIGWEKWWPDTLKLAFLAPVFIFFMYIVLKFLETGLGMFGNAEKDGLSFVIATIIPFAFIMILLMKAKSIAGDMSGEIGQKITGGIAAAGGIALGGAALGAAFLGKKVIGGTLTKASMNDTASQQYMDPEKRAQMGRLRKAVGFVGSGFGTGKGMNKFHDWTGDQLNKRQKNVSHIDHARHTTDEAIAKADPSLKGKKWSQLSQTQRNTVIESVKKEDAAKNAKDAEKKYREDRTNAARLQVKPPVTAARESEILNEEKAKIMKATGSQYVVGTDLDKAKSNASERIEKEKSEVGTAPKLTKADKDNVETLSKNLAEEKFKTELEAAAQQVSVFERAFTQANTGSYDVRALSTNKQDKREGMFTKGSTALVAGVALGVRSALKGSGVNHGTSTGDLGKDLKAIITDSLKNIKVEVPKAAGGDHGGSASKGGDHGGGGHH